MPVPKTSVALHGEAEEQGAALRLAQQLDAMAHAEAARISRLESERLEALNAQKLLSDQVQALVAEVQALRKAAHQSQPSVVAHTIYCAVLSDWRQGLELARDIPEDCVAG